MLMDYEEEYEEKPQLQAEDMQIKENDAPYLDLRDDRERQAYTLIKNREFHHTWLFDPDLLEKAGMDYEFNTIWRVIGWETFVSFDELVSRPLTIQVLCTICEVPDDITF